MERKEISPKVLQAALEDAVKITTARVSNITEEINNDRSERTQKYLEDVYKKLVEMYGYFSE